MDSLSSRSTELKPPGVRKGTWSKEEDELLRKCMEMYGEGKWDSVPKRAGLKRCRKSCRLRWLNYLSPAIHRGKFSDDEVDLIIRLHKLLGNRWSLIAGRIPGRTANDIKNYWNSHLSKKLDAQHEKEEEEATDMNNAGTVVKPQPQRVSKSWTWPKIDPREDLNEGCGRHKVSMIVEHEEWLNELMIKSRREEVLPRAENGSSLGFHFSYEVGEVMDDDALFLKGVEEWEKILQDTIYLE